VGKQPLAFVVAQGIRADASEAREGAGAEWPIRRGNRACTGEHGSIVNPGTRSGVKRFLRVFLAGQGVPPEGSIIGRKSRGLDAGRAERARPVESGGGVPYTRQGLRGRREDEAMSIQTLIVDDEKPARDELAYLLKAFPEISLVGQGKNGLDAVALIKEHNPDLVFLDVQMPGLDGFGVIKKLVERKVRVPHIVFATAYDHYAVQAFEVNAVDYVLKPFDKGRIARAIQRAKKAVEAQASPVDRLESLMGQIGAVKGAQPVKLPVKLLVKSQARMFLVDAEEMVYAGIEDGTITIFAKEFQGTSNYRTIEELAAALDADVFWRAHRSYLVNINHIK
jgi:two-component system response regulator LytT